MSAARLHGDGEDAPASSTVTRVDSVTPDVEVVARIAIQTLFAPSARPSPEDVDAILAALAAAEWQDLGKARETLNAVAPAVHVSEILAAATDDNCAAVCRLLAVALRIASSHPFPLSPAELGAYAVGRALVRLRG